MSYRAHYCDTSPDPYENVYDDRDDPDPDPEGQVDIGFSEQCCSHL